MHSSFFKAGIIYKYNSLIYCIVNVILYHSGSYEKPGAGYKHVYFNITVNTLVIWLLTVVYIICMYEATKYLINLVVKKTARPVFLALFISSFILTTTHGGYTLTFLMMISTSNLFIRLFLA